MDLRLLRYFVAVYEERRNDSGELRDGPVVDVFSRPCTSPLIPVHHSGQLAVSRRPSSSASTSFTEPSTSSSSSWNHVARLIVGRDISGRIVQTRGSLPQFSLGKFDELVSWLEGIGEMRNDVVGSR